MCVKPTSFPLLTAHMSPLTTHMMALPLVHMVLFVVYMQVYRFTCSCLDLDVDFVYLCSSCEGLESGVVLSKLMFRFKSWFLWLKC